MILALDVESSNLPAKGMAIDHPQYPWMMQVAAVLFSFDGRDHAVFSTRIRSEGRTVSEGAQRIHGISTKEAGKTGIPEIVALSAICHFAGQARLLTGFNVEFDRDILQASIIRLGQDPRRLVRPGLQLVDLMRPSAAFCKLPSECDDGSYRWPKLSDALSGIRNERPRQGHHDALRDAMAAKRLFLSLHHRGAFDLSEAA
jgi:DNA polymerase-3 subunit epsilon